MASIRKHVTREVVSLDAAAPIRDAARLMADRNIGSIGVKEDGKLVGLVTERDLVITVLARGGNVNGPIREAMRGGIPRVKADATEAECAAVMRDNTTRHLLVEDKGQTVGVVSMRDIIQLMLDEKQFLIEQLHTYIQGR
jgi:signal-transduction protein with cAMP-binding, CBS, and nucleotidyltransferase domain